MIHIHMDKMLIVDEGGGWSGDNGAETKKKIELMAKFYGIPKENIMGDRGSLKKILKEDHDDIECAWLHHYAREENESR